MSVRIASSVQALPAYKHGKQRHTNRNAPSVQARRTAIVRSESSTMRYAAEDDLVIDMPK